jgi:uncharacterized membrane protein
METIKSLILDYWKNILILILLFFLFSCGIKKESAKEKKDIETSERIETNEVRKGDTVTYIVPNVIYKDTVITTISRQGTILKTYYDKQGNISKSDCISSEIDLLRLELRNTIDKSKIKESVKEESFLKNPLIWIVLALIIIVVMKK